MNRTKTEDDEAALYQLDPDSYLTSCPTSCQSHPQTCDQALTDVLSFSFRVFISSSSSSLRVSPSMYLSLLFILLLSFVTMGTPVAGCLSDRDKDHRLRKNCTGAGFTDIPTGLEPESRVSFLMVYHTEDDMLLQHCWCLLVLLRVNNIMVVPLPCFTVRMAFTSKHQTVSSACKVKKKKK